MFSQLLLMMTTNRGHWLRNRQHHQPDRAPSAAAGTGRLQHPSGRVGTGQATSVRLRGVVAFTPATTLSRADGAVSYRRQRRMAGGEHAVFGLDERLGQKGPTFLTPLVHVAGTGSWVAQHASGGGTRP